MQHSFSKLSLFLVFLTAPLSWAGDVTVSTLNTYFFFNLAYPSGSLKETPRPISQEEYVTKVYNLSTLLTSAQIVGLQEAEQQSISDLAAKLNYKQAYVKGKDTYTGQNVGLLTQRNLTISSHSRVKELDKLVSKHLMAKIKLPDGAKVTVLVVHLIRPIGQQADKHTAQLESITTWANELITQGENVIVLGDFNAKGHSLLGVNFKDVLEPLKSPKTGTFGSALDHIYVSNNIVIKSTVIKQPPYGKKPNDLNKRLWTDHFAVESVLTIQ